jgi:hypothetical protein
MLQACRDYQQWSLTWINNCARNQRLAPQHGITVI